MEGLGMWVPHERSAAMVPCMMTAKKLTSNETRDKHAMTGNILHCTVIMLDQLDWTDRYVHMAVATGVAYMLLSAGGADCGACGTEEPGTQCNPSILTGASGNRGLR
jgi:hypothetical protein